MEKGSPTNSMHQNGNNNLQKDTTHYGKLPSTENVLTPQSRQHRLIKETLAKIKYVLFVMSGKGGVGKSSIAVNLAYTLASKGYSTGLLDIDIHGPSVGNLLGLSSHLQNINEEKKLLPHQYNPNLKVLSIDSLLKNKDTAVLWRGPKKTAAIRQFLSEVHWGNLDFLVIDTPPGTGDEHITFLKAMPEALCIIVTTSQKVALADVRKAINFLQHMNGRILGVVENMSGLLCPACEHKISLFGENGGVELAQKYNVHFLGSIPIDPLAAVAADEGVPVVASLSQESPAQKAFDLLAENIISSSMANHYTIMKVD